MSGVPVSPRVNLKPQSKDIQALIHRAINLGKIYIFVGTPEDNSIQLNDAPNMNTPFSITGLHHIAFQALIAAAQQLGLDKDRDVVDRLLNGSAAFYVKPLRTHVCSFLPALILPTYYF